MHVFDIYRAPVIDGAEDYAAGVPVYTGSIDAWSRKAARVVSNHLAMRSDIRVNRDHITKGRTFRYSVQWRELPKGRYAPLFKGLKRETWAPHPCKCDACGGTGRDESKTAAAIERRQIDAPAYIRCWPCNGNGLDPAKFFNWKG